MIHHGFYPLLAPTASSKLPKGIPIAHFPLNIEKQAFNRTILPQSGKAHLAFTRFGSQCSKMASPSYEWILLTQVISVLCIFFKHTTFSSCLHIWDIRLEFDMVIFIFIRCQWESDAFNVCQGNAIPVNAIMPAAAMNFSQTKVPSH